MTKIEHITQLANKKIHSRYPMLEEPIKEYMTEAVLEVEKELKRKKSAD